jgi:sortase A
MIAAGLGLCAAALWHYVRGYGAQAEGRRAWEERPRPHPPGEYPGVVSASSRPSISSVPAGEPVARIRIPSADVDYVVFEGTDASTLEKGPGHVPGTQLPGSPVGPNNCVITGHRDSHFRHLGWLREGHRIEIETPAGATQSYQIVSRRVVDPTAVQVLDPTPTPRLTLITCYPFNYIGPAPKRLVLVAEPVS